MKGFVDLHCHWIAGIDDGAKSVDASLAMLRGLRQAGFDTVMATPHMRPGMFDNDRAALTTAYQAMQPHLTGDSQLPHVHLASEHFFDDVVFARLVSGEGLPYPDLGALHSRGARRGVLVELASQSFPQRLAARFFDQLLDAGALMLLDVCALVGKYGRNAQQAAEKLLDDETYEAACSDAHRPEDAEVVMKAVEVLEQRVGADETDRLLRRAPRAILGL